MNRVVLVGNIATDIEFRQSTSGVPRATFKMAVQRRYANPQGVREADFLPCIVWRQSAEYLNRYAAKGDKITLSGAIQVRSYDAQDGTKRYVTEINADEVELAGKSRKNESDGNATTKRASAPTESSADAPDDGSFTEYSGDDLPF